MKKILLVFGLFVLTSCSSLLFSVTTSHADFSKYKDVFMTTGDLSSNYTSISLIQVHVRSGTMTFNSSKTRIATFSDALDGAYTKCKELGSNGLINIKIAPYGAGYNYGIILTGLAVKMK